MREPQGSGTGATTGGARPAILRDVARAKVNLTLQIHGRRADGYHELESLVAFTRFGDDVTLDPGRPSGLEVSGPFAPAIGTAGADNLILRAAALYAGPSGKGAASGAEKPPGSEPRAAAKGFFRLEKRIPVAAGLGGGSADAAAALRLLAGLPAADAALEPLLPLAARLGADVPVCLASHPALMTGIGERLRRLPAFPPIPIVLVNPRVPLATADVFRELGAAPLRTPSEETALPAFTSIDDVIAYAGGRTNDLEAPAQRLLPVIGSILDALSACPGARLARLSGSGPTCFALFRETSDAQDAASRLRGDQPQWWVAETLLG